MKNAKWIIYPERRGSVSFKKKYELKKKVRAAYIDITAIGWYHCYINGVRLDTSVFSPGWTSYTHRVQFQRYSIDNLSSSIDLVVELAEGWGGGDRFAWTAPGVFKYFPMSLLYEIHVEYEDGEEVLFSSDEDVDVFTNEIVDATIYYGEQQDAFKQIEYLGKAKLSAVETNVIEQEGPEIIYGERIPAKKMWKDPKGNLLVDFGQNFAGVVEIKIKAKKGEVISYQPCEVLDRDGVFYNGNYRKAARGYYSFVCTGEEDVFVPRFSFLGGRYIRLNEYPENVDVSNFTAVLVHSQMEKTNTFECGNPKLQRLYLNTLYGQLSNYLDVPTDCPQRDERLGWTADAQVFASTGAIHFDVHAFFRKWLHDMIIDQKESGAVPSLIPDIHAGDDIISTGWGDACCVVPVTMYRSYGDKKLLEECVPMMKKWIAFLRSNCKKPNIVSMPFCFGDWLALDKVQIDDGKCQGLTLFELISTAYLAYDISLLIEAYEALGKDTLELTKLLNEVKAAYQNEFIENHHMKGRKVLLFDEGERSAYTQTGIAMTLAFNLCKEEDIPYLTADLVDLIDECGGKMSTGFLGTPCILSALSKNGRIDRAYDLVFQEEYPSWLYSVNKGATTVWEHYDGIKEDGSFWFDSMNSYNHYAYGAVYGWIFENAVGITPLKPGYEEVLISPKPDKRFGYVDSTFKTKNGNVRVKWEYEDDGVSLLVEVDEGVTAYLDLPGRPRELVKRKFVRL